MSHGAQTFSASAQTPCCYYDAALFYVQSSFFFLYHFLSKIRVRSLLLRGNKKRNWIKTVPHCADCRTISIRRR